MQVLPKVQRIDKGWGWPIVAYLWKYKKCAQREVFVLWQKIWPLNVLETKGNQSVAMFPLNKCIILDKNSAVLGVKKGQTCSMCAHKYSTLIGIPC